MDKRIVERRFDAQRIELKCVGRKQVSPMKRYGKMWPIHLQYPPWECRMHAATVLERPETNSRASPWVAHLSVAHRCLSLFSIVFCWMSMHWSTMMMTEPPTASTRWFLKFSIRSTAPAGWPPRVWHNQRWPNRRIPCRECRTAISVNRTVAVARACIRTWSKSVSLRSACETTKWARAMDRNRCTCWSPIQRFRPLLAMYNRARARAPGQEKRQTATRLSHRNRYSRRRLRRRRQCDRRMRIFASKRMQQLRIDSNWRWNGPTRSPGPCSRTASSLWTWPTARTDICTMDAYEPSGRCRMRRAYSRIHKRLQKETKKAFVHCGYVMADCRIQLTRIDVLLLPEGLHEKRSLAWRLANGNMNRAQ